MKIKTMRQAGWNLSVLAQSLQLMNHYRTYESSSFSSMYWSLRVIYEN